MIFDTNKPQTAQEYINSLPVSELSEFFAEAYQADYKFEERDCPAHGKVIDWYSEEGEGDAIEYKLIASYPEWIFKEQLVIATVQDLAFHSLLGNLHNRSGWTIRDCVKKSIMFNFFQGIFKEGVLLNLLGCHFVEIRHGEWELQDIPTQKEEV
jgi:hypothetical protein